MPQRLIRSSFCRVYSANRTCTQRRTVRLPLPWDETLNVAFPRNTSCRQPSTCASICRGREVLDVCTAYIHSLPPTGARPKFVRKIFAHANIYCCDSKMRVHRLEATFYGRHECNQTWYYVKQNTGWRGASYLRSRDDVKGRDKRRRRLAALPLRKDVGICARAH